MMFALKMAREQPLHVLRCGRDVDIICLPCVALIQRGNGNLCLLLAC